MIFWPSPIDLICQKTQYSDKFSSKNSIVKSDEPNDNALLLPITYAALRVGWQGPPDSLLHTFPPSHSSLPSNSPFPFFGPPSVFTPLSVELRCSTMATTHPLWHGSVPTLVMFPSMQMTQVSSEPKLWCAASPIPLPMHCSWSRTALQIPLTLLAHGVLLTLLLAACMPN